MGSPPLKRPVADVDRLLFANPHNPKGASEA